MCQEKYDNGVELFSRMCEALENFVSFKNPHTFMISFTCTIRNFAFHHTTKSKDTLIY